MYEATDTVFCMLNKTGLLRAYATTPDNSTD